jgi:hypothetical protein
MTSEESSAIVVRVLSPGGTVLVRVLESFDERSNGFSGFGMAYRIKIADRFFDPDSDTDKGT